MSIRNRLILVLTGAFVLTVLLAACGDIPTHTEIIQTSAAFNKIENATATAEVVLAAGGNPDEVEVEVGTGSMAEKHNISAAATAKAEAEQGIVAEGVGSGAEVLQGAAFDVDIPDGPAETGVIVVDIPQIGAEGMVFDPAIVKIKVGATVRWTNNRRSASSSTSDPGQGDSWDSGSFSKGTFDKEAARFEHTFNIPGCFTYKSLFSGDNATGAVCVVE
jgi:plastocyanin